jgi:parallel beta-helix repeat protein
MKKLIKYILILTVLIVSVSSATTNNVYFMGNSLTSDTRYTDQVGLLLGNSYGVVNKGIGGQTTADMLARFTTDITNHADCKFVVIMGGTNDVGNYTVASIESNLQAMYTAAHNASIKVVAVTIPPRASTGQHSQTDLLTINTWILNTATNIDYKVNSYTLLNDVNNPGNLLPIYDGDHVHLSTLGYTLLGTTVFNSVNEWTTTTYYVATTGANAGHAGTINDPWLTLSYACSQIATPGYVIHVNAGTYIENSTCYLSPGVSIIGEGITSVITSTTLTGTGAEIINLTSATLTDGAQTISNLKFDGGSLTVSKAIWIEERSNVKIHDCTFINFHYMAVHWTQNDVWSANPPASFMTGSEFYNNTVTNCASYPEEGLYLGGQIGMLIHDNTITQTGRTAGTNGEPIYMLWMKGAKIYNNVLFRGDITNYTFCIEGFYCFGLEVYNNTLTGSIDLNYVSKDVYTYGLYVHDNTIGPEVYTAGYLGIDLEFNANDIIIRYNKIRNCLVGIAFAPRSGSTISNCEVSYNILENIQGNSSAGMTIYTVSSPYTIANWNIYNNVFSGNATDSYCGLYLNDFASATGINIINNVFMNIQSTYWFTCNVAGNINGMNIKNNILYNNGNGNAASFTGTPTNYINSGNIVSNPSFISTTNFNLHSGSPAINAGTNVGLTRDFRGAAILGVPDIGAYEYTGAITTTLPVQVTSFTGAVQGNTIALDWKTATEVNSYMFEIERRTSAQLQWESIGKIPAGGTSNAPLEYRYIDSLKNVSSGSIFYRLKSIANDGSFQYNGEADVFVTTSVTTSVPNKYALSQNYPNPFNPTTTINYQLQKAGSVSLKVYDMLGRAVAILVNEDKTAGYYSVVFDASRLSSGTYFYRLITGSFTEIKKMVLLK